MATTKNSTTKKISIKTIDILPTWRQAMSIYITSLEHGNEQGKKSAREELYRIADYLDMLNKKNKK